MTGLLGLSLKNITNLEKERENQEWRKFFWKQNPQSTNHVVQRKKVSRTLKLTTSSKSLPSEKILLTSRQLSLPHFESPDDLCWKWKGKIRNNTDSTSMDFIEALSAAYLTSHNMFCPWWGFGAALVVCKTSPGSTIYMCVCVCVHLHGTKKNAINCFLHPLCHSIFLSTVYNDNDWWIKKCQLVFFFS